MATHTEYDTVLYDRASSSIKTHGILSIIFGSLGVFGALIATSFIALASFVPFSEGGTIDTADSLLGTFLIGLVVFLFFTVPHIFMIFAGIKLLHEPKPSVAKTLIIINLVIGVFWNLVTLIFAIINLTQITDYKNGYVESKAQ